MSDDIHRPVALAEHPLHRRIYRVPTRDDVELPAQRRRETCQANS